MVCKWQLKIIKRTIPHVFHKNKIAVIFPKRIVIAHDVGMVEAGRQYVSLILNLMHGITIIATVKL